MTLNVTVPDAVYRQVAELAARQQVSSGGHCCPTRRTTSSWNWPWRAGPISCLPSTPRTSRGQSASAFE